MRQLQLGIQTSELPLCSRLLPSPTAVSQQPKAGINEIILATDSALQPIYLLPILAQMSLDKRWLMWIANDPSINRNWVNALGIDASHVLHINAEKGCFLDVCCKALAAGTGHIIIEWDGSISDKELAQLDSAAQTGASHALLIRRR